MGIAAGYLNWLHDPTTQQRMAEQKRAQSMQFAMQHPELFGSQPMPQPPVAPQPGQASVPAPQSQQGGSPGQGMPPQPGGQAMPQGQPGMPQGQPPPPQQQPQGWQGLPQGQAIQPQQPQQGTLPPPPIPGGTVPSQDTGQPQQAWNIQGFLKSATRAGATPQQAIDMLDQFAPFMMDQNKQELQNTKIQLAAQTAAQNAYLKTIDEQRKQLDDERKMIDTRSHQEDVDSKVKTREETVDINKRKVSQGGTSGTGGRASVAMSGDSLGQGKNQRGLAAEEIQKLYHPDLSLPEIGQKMAQAEGLRKSVNTQRVMQGKITGFENTALRNLKQLRDELDKQRQSGKTDFPTVNSLLGKWKQQTGQVYNEGIGLFGQELSGELAKLASSATATGAGGTLTDREEWKQFFGPNGSFDQMTKYLDSAETAVKIRVNSSQDAIDGTESEIKSLWGSGGGGGKGATGATGSDPAIEAILKKHAL